MPIRAPNFENPPIGLDDFPESYTFGGFKPVRRDVWRVGNHIKCTVSLLVAQRPGR